MVILKLVQPQNTHERYYKLLGIWKNVSFFT